MKSILLIDDEPIFNILHTKLIQRLFPEAIINKASNGEEALEHLRKGASDGSAVPEVIMVDLFMPMMDGFGFLKEFQKLNVPGKSDMIVIMLSSASEPTVEKKAKELGATHFLEKPCNDESLLKVLNSRGA